MEYLLSVTTDKKERAYLINHFLEQFRGTLYRQTMFAEFELAANEMTQRGEGTTAEALCAMYKKLNEQYFGPEMNVDEEISLEWARIPHFYYDYYVYQYATGYAAAIALSRRILREGEPAVKDYLLPVRRLLRRPNHRCCAARAWIWQARSRSRTQQSCLMK